jgi:hypothetical protein
VRRLFLAVALLFGAGVAEPSIIYKRPALAQYQLDAIFNDARYGLIEASTKSGKTHGCLAWLFEQALMGGRAGRNYWWVAPTYAQAEIAYRRMALAIPMALRKCNDSKRTIALPNSAVIWFKSAEDPDNLYGEDVYAAVFDEASRGREEAWFALRSTLTKTRGKVRLIGNVKGRLNWFYKMARKAEAGEPGHSFKRIRAADAVAAGIIDAAEVEDAKRTLPANVYKELFEAEPSDDSGNPFGIEAIRAAIRPVSDAAAEAFGVDLAKSVDWTVALGLDSEGLTCAFDRFQLPWTETISRVKTRVGRAATLVDSTGVGDPVLEALQRGGSRNFEGYKFSSESKQRLMEGLAVAIQRGEVGYPEGPIVKELEAFEFEYTRTGVKYSGPSGMHDDCVMALALAVQARANLKGRPRLRVIA